MARRIGRRTAIASGATGLASLAGCLDVLGDGGGPPGSDGGGQGWTIKLGVLAPQTGSLETIGPDVADAVRLVKRQIDVAPNDFSVDLSVKDTESDPETAVTRAQELVDDGYQAIVGPGSGEESTAVVEDVLVPEGVVAISPLTATSLGDVDDEDLMFSTAPRASHLGTALSRPIAIAGTKSVSVIHTANRYGTGIGTLADEELTTRGIDVPSVVAIEDLEADSYVSVLEEALADDPDSLVAAVDPAVGVQLLKDFYSEFEGKPVFLTDRLRLPTLPSQVASDMEAARVVSLKPRWARGRVGSDDGGANESQNGTGRDTETATGEDAELLTPFLPAFRTAFERIPTIQAAQSFDAAAVLALAAVRTGQDSYGGAEISGRVRQVANAQDNFTGVRLFSYDDYWEGLSVISEGVRNNYIGASGAIEFDPETGRLLTPLLHAVRFEPDRELGFEEIIPIPT